MTIAKQFKWWGVPGRRPQIMDPNRLVYEIQILSAWKVTKLNQREMFGIMAWHMNDHCQTLRGVLHGRRPPPKIDPHRLVYTSKLCQFSNVHHGQRSNSVNLARLSGKVTMLNEQENFRHCALAHERLLQARF